MSRIIQGILFFEIGILYHGSYQFYQLNSICAVSGTGKMRSENHFQVNMSTQKISIIKIVGEDF
jgi:hypothetical protein